MTSEAKPVLVSARLRLRAVTAGDAMDLWALDADPEVRRYVHQPETPTLESIRDSMIPRWQGFDLATPAMGYWVAEAIGGGEDSFIGWFHLRPPTADGPLGADDLELGFRLRRAVWGRGLASEGARTLLGYGFDRLAA